MLVLTILKLAVRGDPGKPGGQCNFYACTGANPAKTICSGDNAAYEILLAPANLPAGTVFNWPDPDGAGPATAGVNVPMGAAGTTHINDVLTNATTASLAITYVVTPSTGGCAGAPQNIVINVNPTPVLAAGQAKSICTGANVAYEILLNPAGLPTGTLFSWPDPDGCRPCNGWGERACWCSWNNSH